MQHELSGLRDNIISEIKNASSLAELEVARVSALGKKGKLTELMKELSKIGDEERRNIVSELNNFMKEIITLIEIRKRQF